MSIHFLNQNLQIFTVLGIINIVISVIAPYIMEYVRGLLLSGSGIITLTKKGKITFTNLGNIL